MEPGVDATSGFTLAAMSGPPLERSCSRGPPAAGALERVAPSGRTHTCGARSRAPTGVRTSRSSHRSRPRRTSRSHGARGTRRPSSCRSSRRRGSSSSTAKIIPCPAGKITPTGKRVTCVSCRLCLDHDLLWMKAAIGFAAHGPGAGKVVEALAQIRLRKIGSLGDSGDEHEHQRDHGGQCVEGAGQDQGGHHASR